MKKPITLGGLESMCHYITATFPAQADIDKVREVFLSYKLGFEEIQNSSVEEHIEKGDHYILTTNGMCDCGTVLGSEFRENSTSTRSKTSSDVDTLEKLRKKGWSGAKIERWMREAELTKQKDERRAQLNHESSICPTHDWLNVIRDILASKATNRIGLLVHMYEGPLSGRIKIKGQKTISVAGMTEDILLNIEEDFIYNFVSK